MIRIFKIITAHVCAVAIGIASLFPAQAVLADTKAPFIVHELVRESLPEGSSYKVFATVTDDSVVTQVRLHYRVAGESPQFKTKNMIEESSGNYAATLSANDIIQPGVEYYITALDSAGNSQSRGFAFEPLSINVIAPAVSTAATSETTPAGKSNKTLWYILGGVAIAGIIAAASGGSTEAEELCPCPLGLEN